MLGDSHYIQKLKWIKDLNVKPKTENLLEETIEVNLHDLEFGRDFVDITPTV